jgi:conjugative transfer region protein TrbK
VGRPDIFRLAPIFALIGVFVATLFAIERRPPTPSFLGAASVSAPDDLSAELRRCSALGPQDAEVPRCQEVWEENRRRFFGGSARPLPPIGKKTAAPVAALTTNPASGDAR